MLENINTLENILWAIKTLEGQRETLLADSKKELFIWTGTHLKMIHEAEIKAMAIQRLRLRFKKVLANINEEAQKWK